MFDWEVRGNLEFDIILVAAPIQFWAHLHHDKLLRLAQTDRHYGAELLQEAGQVGQLLPGQGRADP